MSEYVLREARAEDDAAVGELLVEAFVESYARKLPDVVVTAHRKADLRNVAAKREVAKVWVAVDGARVVGTIAVWPPGSHRSEAWISGAADLRHLAVARTHRGGLVSSLLIDTAEAWARSNACVAMSLHVRQGAAGVRALYEKRGYQRRPEGDLDQRPEVFLEAFVLPLSPATR